MNDADRMVKLRRVIKRRGGADRSFELVIDAIDVRAGEPLAFVGPSGCGKSTLIDLLAMTLKPDDADTFLLADPNGRAPIDIAALWRSGKQDRLGRLRARRFGYVIQTGGLLPFLSVRENIALPQKVLGAPDPGLVSELAQRLGIAEQLSAMPARLSVGQRQRVAIARALAHRPAIVLADEPTASLDPVNAGIVMELFVDLVERFGAALVLVTHDEELAARFGIPAVRAGVARWEGASRTVFSLRGHTEAQRGHRQPMPEPDLGYAVP